MMMGHVNVEVNMAGRRDYYYVLLSLLCILDAHYSASVSVRFFCSQQILLLSASSHSDLMVSHEVDKLTQCITNANYGWAYYALALTFKLP